MHLRLIFVATTLAACGGVTTDIGLGGSGGEAGSAGSIPSSNGSSGATTSGTSSQGSAGEPGSAGSSVSSGAGGASSGGAGNGASGSNAAGGAGSVMPNVDGGANGGGNVMGGGCAGPSGTPIGWAAVSGMGVMTTTGGVAGTTMMVASLADLNRYAGGNTAMTIQLTAAVSGTVSIGSNKTIVGCGGSIHGHVSVSRSSNVIVRNLTIVGNNCSDNSDCQSGADAVTIGDGAHHVWFDHDDISDGSDGNLDITSAADFVTVSWTKFHYSNTRVGGHEFSNLIGSADTTTGDTGHLNVTFHHDWWADHVNQRMPRVRFGQVHLFNDLYTATGNSYCIGVGVSANILDENNAFIGVKNPIDSNSFSDGASIVQSRGNLYQGASGSMADLGGTAFKPSYAYSLDAAASVQGTVQSAAGPH
jgi:pectate lyase